MNQQKELIYRRSSEGKQHREYEFVGIIKYAEDRHSQRSAGVTTQKIPQYNIREYEFVGIIKYAENAKDCHWSKSVQCTNTEGKI